MISFSRSEICCSCWSPPPPPPPPPSLLGLRVIELERHGFDEHHVRFLRVLAIPRDGVKADNIARNGFEIFHGKHGGAIRLLRALVFEQVDGFLRPAIQRIAQTEFLQRIFVFRGNLRRRLLQSDSLWRRAPASTIRTVGRHTLRASMK